MEEYLEHNVTDQNRYAARCFLRLRETRDPCHVIGVEHVFSHSRTQLQPVYSVQQVNVYERIASPDKTVKEH